MKSIPRVPHPCRVFWDRVGFLTLLRNSALSSFRLEVGAMNTVEERRFSAA